MESGRYRLCFNSPVDKVDGIFDIHGEIPVKKVRLGPTMAYVDVDPEPVNKYNLLRTIRKKPNSKRLDKRAGERTDGWMNTGGAGGERASK